MAEANNDGDELARLRQELLVFVLDQAATDQETIDRIAGAIESALTERVSTLIDRRLAPHAPDQIAEKVAAILQSRLPALSPAVELHTANLPPEPISSDNDEPLEEIREVDSEQHSFVTQYRRAILSAAMVLVFALVVAVTWIVAEAHFVDQPCAPRPSYEAVRAR